MIKYQLRCDSEHEFEGWFQSSAGFDEQSARGLVNCPVCDSVNVKRALMAPNLSSPKTRKSEAPMDHYDGASQGDKSGPVMKGPAPRAASPAQGLSPAAVEKMQALMSEMREVQARIKAECRDVGTDFAEEARKIHYGEAEPEAIYGQTSKEEREELDEEGIDVVDIPWLPSDN